MEELRKLGKMFRARKGFWRGGAHELKNCRKIISILGPLLYCNNIIACNPCGDLKRFIEGH